MGTVTAGVAKVLVKSPLPPVQKAGIVMAVALVSAGIQVSASALNRLNSSSISSTPAGSSTSNLSKGV